ncbi:MAG TPA: alpha-amylase family glycosyl hydrolase [Acidimicrobiales bacterium]|nr:alpha-amylase family glycosyl hydrolase [Acidimicrobiales bacterium]
MTPPWWADAVFYEIYVPSFCRGRPPSAGPGLAPAGGRMAGDLAGIRRRLDHLQWLGVDALWLTPFYPSPMADFGYDVADYCDVSPAFGTLDDFDRLLADARDRGIRVIADWVPNHTSDRHPWFVDARSSRQSPHREWYVWRDGSPDRPPNNWTAAFTRGPAWTWDEATGQWYLHLFLPEQPDLDWSNPAVEAAMHDVLRFWLDRGIDGFRVDVVHALGKDPALPDAPPDRAHLPWSSQNDDPRTHPILRRLRALVDSYAGDRCLVGEVYLLSTTRVARYYGQGDELHMAFNFPPLYAPWTADAWRHRIRRVEEEMGPIGAWPTWVLSNHDNARHRTRYGSEARARAAAVLLLGLRGTPFLYAGEELGLEDAEVPADRVVDPGGRDGCRAPIPWEAGAGHGWEGADRTDVWLPWPPDPDRRNAAYLRSDPGSILHLYRRLLAARRASPALRRGGYEELDAPEGVLAFRRVAADRPGDDRVVLVNFGDSDVGCAAPWPATVVVDSRGEGEGGPYAGVLGASAAVVLAPG